MKKKKEKKRALGFTSGSSSFYIWLYRYSMSEYVLKKCQVTKR